MDFGAYTLARWGAAQAVKYLLTIEACCERLARHPLLGRACNEISPGLRRMEQGRHVIFYRERSDGILVARILHQDMEPQRHTL